MTISAYNRVGNVVNIKLDDNKATEIEKITQELGIHLIPYNFSKLNERYLEQVEKEGKIVSALILSETRSGIFFDESLPVTVQRHVIASELGHFLSLCKKHQVLSGEHTHLTFANNIYKKSPYNDFSAKLLMPDKELIYVFSHLLVPSYDTVSSIMEVPKALLIYRMESSPEIFNQIKKENLCLFG